MKKLYLFFLVAGTMLSSCMVGPNYSPPCLEMPQVWTTEAAVCSTPPEEWWEQFGDPLLKKYILLGRSNNNTVLTAEANIGQARGMRQVAASALFPHLSTSNSAIYSYFSQNGPLGALSSEGQGPIMQALYSSLVDVFWELDFFGKRKREVEVEVAKIGGQIARRNQALVSVTGEIALSYIQIRGSQKSGQVLADNIAILEKIQQILQKKIAVGYSNQIDLQRIEGEIAKLYAELPSICAKMYQGIYALSCLTGNLPATLLEELLPIQPLPCFPENLSVGIPSDLLRRRPDICQAERDLAASTAGVGVAIASFFPSFNLLGNLGLQAINPLKLFDIKSLTWTALGAISYPLFQGGKLCGNLTAKKWQQAAAFYSYRQVVLNAIAEAETALSNVKQERASKCQLETVAQRYDSLLQIVSSRFTKGLANINDVLDVERERNRALQKLANSETKCLEYVAKLYKALGGGWEVSCQASCIERAQ